MINRCQARPTVNPGTPIDWHKALEACAVLATLFAGMQLNGQAAGAKAPTSFATISKQAIEARDAQKLEAAIPLFQRAVKLKPDWDEGWWNLGSLTYDKDRFDECAVAFRHLVALHPDSAPGWTMSGLCEYKLRQFEPALESFRRTEQLQFQEPHELATAARLHYALVLIKTGRFEKAITTLSDLTKFDSKNAQIVVAAGIAGLRKPWLPSEVPEPERDKVTKLGDAMASGMEKDYKSAIAKFEAVLAAYPDDPDVNFRFGAYMQHEDPERGLVQLKKAIELDPNHIPALLGLAAIYTNRVEAEPAKMYAEKAVRAAPNEFAPHVALGRALLAGDDAAGAVKELELAVSLAPDSPDARFNLASAYLRLGRKQDAQRQQEEFRRLKKLMESGSA